MNRDALWIGVLCVIIVAIVIIIVRQTRHEMADCEDQGGTIVHVHNSQTGEWFCQEPR